jgi:predicted permease
MTGLFQDLRHGARLLLRNPLFALTASLSLAIGIGATTAIFTIANALLFRAPAGVAQPETLVDIFHTERDNRMAGPVVSYSRYLEVRRRSTLLNGVYAYKAELTPIGLRAAGGAERVFGCLVSMNYFTLLGVRPAAGRLFSPDDREEAGASPIVVLSHEFWTRRFNADPAVVGRVLQLNGHPFAVIGVAQETFRGTSVVFPDVWVPTAMTSAVMPGTPAGFLQVLMGARLKPGVSLQQAAAEVEALGRALERESPQYRPGPDGTREATGAGLGVVAASPIPGNLRPIIGGFFALLMGTVSIVLFIACANLAGILLARGTARRAEIAVRLAIGAGRTRLLRQLLIETVLLFTLGGVAGLMLARGMTSVLLLLLPAFPQPVGVSLPLDIRVMSFTAALSLLAAVLSGLVPALQASKADVVSALKAGSEGPAARVWLRHAFVVGQVSFSLLLVVVAGLLVRAQERVSSVNPGFDARGIEVASVDLSLAGYSNTTGPSFVRQLLDRVRELPGVQTATIADRIPEPGRILSMFGEELHVPGFQTSNGRPFMPNWSMVEPGYFDTLRIALIAGRDFSEMDSANAPLVAIVPETTARRLFGEEDPVGKVLTWRSNRPNAPATTRTLMVIGVARDLNDNRRPSGDSRSLPVYVPLQQRYSPRLEILTRATQGQRLASQIRTLVASLDPDLPILNLQMLDDQLSGPVEVQLRIAASVSGSLGLVGVLLAGIGIYGVVAQSVARRTREIGIRIAIGAPRGDVVGMILRQGMFLVLMGGIVGLLLAGAASRLLISLLFGLSPLDLLTFVGAALLFAAIGLLACYIPARRAARVDPLVALRYE